MHLFYSLLLGFAFMVITLGGSALDAHAQSASLSGRVLTNLGNSLMVETSTIRLFVHFTRATKVFSEYRERLPLSAVLNGAMIYVEGTPTATGMFADVIIVSAPQTFPGYPPTSIFPQNLYLEWPVFVRQHPHDWNRGRPHWERAPQGHSRDWRHHEWRSNDRDGRHTREWGKNTGSRDRWSTKGGHDERTTHRRNRD